MQAPDQSNDSNNNQEVKVQSGLKMKSSAAARASNGNVVKNNSSRLAGVKSSRSSARNRAGARDPKSNGATAGAGGFKEDG